MKKTDSHVDCGDSKDDEYSHLPSPESLKYIGAEENRELLNVAMALVVQRHPLHKISLSQVFPELAPITNFLSENSWDSFDERFESALKKDGDQA